MSAAHETNNRDSAMRAVGTLGYPLLRGVLWRRCVQRISGRLISGGYRVLLAFGAYRNRKTSNYNRQTAANCLAPRTHHDVGRTTAHVVAEGGARKGNNQTSTVGVALLFCL